MCSFNIRPQSGTEILNNLPDNCKQTFISIYSKDETVSIMQKSNPHYTSYEVHEENIIPLETNIAVAY